MRDIKYRARRRNNGEWVYGNLVCSPDATEDFNTIIIPIVNSDMFSSDYNSDLGFETWYKVIPETVGEYTGFPDKDKTEICEHDILLIEIINFATGNVIVAGNAVVEYRDGMYGVKWGRDFTPLSGFSKQFTRFTVVGTKFENPELLQEASK